MLPENKTPYLWRILSIPVVVVVVVPEFINHRIKVNYGVDDNKIECFNVIILVFITYIGKGLSQDWMYGHITSISINEECAASQPIHECACMPLIKTAGSGLC